MITTAAIPELKPFLHSQPQSVPSTLLNAILISSISQFIPHNMNEIRKVEQYGKILKKAACIYHASRLFSYFTLFHHSNRKGSSFSHRQFLLGLG